MALLLSIQQTTPHKKGAQQGFTLIEVMLVVVLMAVLMAVVVVGLGVGQGRQNQLIYEQLLNDLKLVRLTADQNNQVLAISPWQNVESNQAGYRVLQLVQGPQGGQWQPAQSFKTKLWDAQTIFLIKPLNNGLDANQANILGNNSNQLSGVVFFGQTGATPVSIQVQHGDDLIGSPIEINDMGEVLTAPTQQEQPQ